MELAIPLWRNLAAATFFLGQLLETEMSWLYWEVCHKVFICRGSAKLGMGDDCCRSSAYIDTIGLQYGCASSRLVLRLSTSPDFRRPQVLKG